MRMFVYVLQIVVALGLLNVWLLRFNKTTAFRGGAARSMPEEFAAYGLPVWSTYVVGALKIGAAICLIAGVWLHFLVFPAALLVCILMVGALAMHLKVRDPLSRLLPALAVLVMSAIICFGSTR